MHLPASQRQLLLKAVEATRHSLYKNRGGHWLLAIFALLIVVVSKVSAAGTPPARAISAAELNTTQIYLENVSLVGTLLAKKPAKGGNGIVFDLEGVDGRQYVAYISPDVRSVPVGLGDSLEVTGSSIGQGALAVTRPDGVKLLKRHAAKRTVYGVEVRNGIAYWQSGNSVSRITTSLPDGLYPSLALITDGNGYRSLEAEDK